MLPLSQPIKHVAQCHTIERASRHPLSYTGKCARTSWVRLVPSGPEVNPRIQNSVHRIDFQTLVHDFDPLVQELHRF